MEGTSCLISSAGAWSRPELAVGDELPWDFWKGYAEDQRCSVANGPQDRQCSTRCPNPCRPRSCTTSGAPTPKPPSTSSSQPTARPQSAWSRTVNACELLRLPGRALEAHQAPATPSSDLVRTVKTKGCLAQDGARHGLQTDLEARRVAEAGRIKSTRRTRRRSAVQGRNQDNQTRRLIAPSPTFGHSSRRCTAWSSMRRFVWRLSTRV